MVDESLCRSTTDSSEYDSVDVLFVLLTGELYFIVAEDI